MVVPGTGDRELTLLAPDGHPLAATHLPSRGRQAVVIAPATAVPRGRYRALAAFLQARGWDVLTFDYRGIGGSRLAHPRLTPEIRYHDWGAQDLGAAVAWAAHRMPTWLVGHAFGGNALSLVPDPSLLRGAYLLGAGSGWSGRMPLGEAVRTAVLWRTLGPLAERGLGYIPQNLVGLGEDLPVGVYRDRRHWCSGRGYFLGRSDPLSRLASENCLRVRLPIVAANATDDRWVPPASRDALLHAFANATIEPVDLDPERMGLRRIGHQGYIRREVGGLLWPLITERLDLWAAGEVASA